MGGDCHSSPQCAQAPDEAGVVLGPGPDYGSSEEPAPAVIFGPDVGFDDGRSDARGVPHCIGVSTFGLVLARCSTQEVLQ